MCHDHDCRVSCGNPSIGGLADRRQQPTVQLNQMFRFLGNNLFKTQELCLSQHVKDATRIRQNQTPTTLDYIFTEEENLIETINYEVPLGKSDHVVLTWKLLLATSSVPSNQVKYNNTIKGTIAVSRVVCR